ncbi:MAG: class II aldolase/adducin family protein [Patescibacteria group bacterium]|jgi:ribulose-5-phosphate 4-epimerase/fuculose-1-phosphate aldolase
MKSANDGYIKFQLKWIKGRPVPSAKIKKLNQWRKKLYGLGLIGLYNNGIGFGNLSVRSGKTGNFIITGSETGRFKILSANHYARVVGHNFEKNRLTCRGPIKASSESLSHAIIYRMDKNINYVMHLHNLKLWKKLKNKVPTTSAKAAYGTPEMAWEIEKLFKQTDVKDKHILVMAGHREGLMTFGSDAETAGKAVLRFMGQREI